METNLDSLFAKWDERKEFDGYHNGYAYVDLDLPSGTKWAADNITVDLLNSNSLLFQFGKTDGYAYGDTNNKFTTGFDNETLTGDAYINMVTSDTKYGLGSTLSLADDAAHVNLGGDWIMPTKDDLQELYDNTTRIVTVVEDKKGMLFTSNINHKSIFIPFDGFYDCFDDEFVAQGTYSYLWSSSVNLNTISTASCLYFDLEGHCYVEYIGRAIGCSVRGVLK